MTQDAQQLLPCPFCGGEAEIESEGVTWYIWCDTCDFSIDWFVSSSHAIQCWNRRAESADHAALTKRVADLEETLAFAAQYKGIEARACPLCHYENGVFVDRCQMHKDMDALTKQVAELEAALAAANAEIAERDASFDLRWSADMEAIKQWQEATGRKLVWPGHGDLCVWLMAQLAEAKRWEPVTGYIGMRLGCKHDIWITAETIDGLAFPDNIRLCRVAGEGGNGN